MQKGEQSGRWRKRAPGDANTPQSGPHLRSQGAQMRPPKKLVKKLKPKFNQEIIFKTLS